MGGHSYNVGRATITSAAYLTESVDNTFKQNVIGKAHEKMDARNISMREARDSELHPESARPSERAPFQFLSDGFPVLQVQKVLLQASENLRHF